MSGVTSFVNQAGASSTTFEAASTIDSMDRAPTRLDSKEVSELATPSEVSAVSSPSLKSSEDPSIQPVTSTKNSLNMPDKSAQLAVLKEKVATCTLCPDLAVTRTQTVFGTGDANAKIVFMGEAPGAQEDETGEPFVGRAGQLLTKIIEACTLSRSQVFILNTLKCRPPGNRNPTPEEVTHCRPYFDEQLAIIQPQYLVCLGAIAARSLLATDLAIGKLRGKFHNYNDIKVLATYHPAYLLRNPSAKKEVWLDMQFLMKDIGIPLPASKNP